LIQGCKRFYQLIDLGKNEKVALLYIAKDEERNNAQALLEVLKNK